MEKQRLERRFIPASLWDRNEDWNGFYRSSSNAQKGCSCGTTFWDGQANRFYPRNWCQDAFAQIASIRKGIRETESLMKRSRRIPSSHLASGQQFFRVYEGHCSLPALLRMEPYGPLVYSLLHSDSRVVLFLEPVSGAVCAFSFRPHNEPHASHSVIVGFLSFPILCFSHNHTHPFITGSTPILSLTHSITHTNSVECITAKTERSPQTRF